MRLHKWSRPSSARRRGAGCRGKGCEGQGPVDARIRGIFKRRQRSWIGLTRVILNREFRINSKDAAVSNSVLQVRHRLLHEVK
eukprot:1160053-Pelagomonas_calceolata.AAC.8